jgi:replicative DNA helicase
LPGNHFYNPHRENVWNVCRELSTDRTPIDPVTVGRRLADRGEWNPATKRVVQVEMSNPAPASHAVAHSATLTDLHRRRELIQALSRANQQVAEHTGDSSEVLAAVRRQFDGLDQEESPDRKSTTLTWSQLVDEFEQAHAPGGTDQGICSPWYQLDELLGALHRGRMYTFGGRPGAGKSTAALNVAEHAAVESGKNVLIFSKEMPTVDVMGRVLAWGAQVNVSSINHRRLDDFERERIRAYIRKVGQPKIRVNASPVSLEGIKTIARAQHHRNGLDLLVVDYLQLVKSDQAGRSREQEVGKVSSDLKALAMELDIVVVLPAQLNRGPASRADARPQMSDLRDSGQIEQDSDAVILLWHQLNEKGEPTGNVTFIVDKNRHGPRGELELRWHGGYGGIGDSR